MLIPVKSFRLSKKQIEDYETILSKLKIDGDNESEKFRNLIDFLNDYFESGLEPIPNIFIEREKENESLNSSKIDIFELMMAALKSHEKSLNIIVRKLEKVQSPPQLASR